MNRKKKAGGIFFLLACALFFVYPVRAQAATMILCYNSVANVNASNPQKTCTTWAEAEAYIEGKQSGSFYLELCQSVTPTKKITIAAGVTVTVFTRKSSYQLKPDASTLPGVVFELKKGSRINFGNNASEGLKNVAALTIDGGSASRTAAVVVTDAKECTIYQHSNCTVRNLINKTSGASFLAVHHSDTKVTLKGTFTNCKTSNGCGGAVAAGYDDAKTSKIENCTITLDGVTASGCEATRGHGGFLYVGKELGNSTNKLTVKGKTSIKNCTAGDSGGAIGSFGPVTLGECTISNNTASGSYSFDGDTTYGNGGGIACWVQPITVGSKATLSGNQALKSSSNQTGEGGNLFVSLGSVCTVQSGSVISGGRAVEGGGIYATGKSAVIINGGAVYGNQAKNRGGAIATPSDSSSNKIGAAQIYNNSAQYGGALYLMSGGVMTLSNATLGYSAYSSIKKYTESANKATEAGSEIYLSNSTLKTASVNTLVARGEQSTVYVTKSSEIVSGGTFYILAADSNWGLVNYGTVNAKSGTFYVYAENGSAIYNAGTLTLATEAEIGGRCKIKKAGITELSPSAASASGYSYCGIYNSGNVNIKASTVKICFNGTQGTGKGGGIRNYGTLTMTAGEISANGASLGGGIYNDSAGTFVYSGGTIKNNRAEHGGGIANEGTMKQSGGTVSGNSASNCGDGIYQNGTYEISSAAKIGNGSGSGNCVYLTKGSYVTVTGSSLTYICRLNSAQKTLKTALVYCQDTTAAALLDRFSHKSSEVDEIYPACEAQIGTKSLSYHNPDKSKVIWISKRYTISYAANIEQEYITASVPDAQTAHLGWEIILCAQKAKVTDAQYADKFTFLSWNTRSDGLGTTYAYGGYTFGTGTLTGDLKLYAQWETSVGAVEADNVVVTYYGNGAKTADGSTKFTDEVADEALSYTFLENPFYSGNGVVYLSDNEDYVKTDSKTVATYMGWSGQSADTILKSTAKIYQPKTAITRKLLLNSSFRISESNGAVLVPVYAIWDYYPTVTASDLVLELSEAEKGMSAATLMERIGAKASDREDGDSIINQSSRLKLLDYDPSVLTSLQMGESMTVTLSATDTAGNETRKTVCISVKDPNAMEVIYRCMSYERFGTEIISSSNTTMRYMSHSTNKRFSEANILAYTTVLYMQNAAVTYPKLYDASGSRVSVQQNVTEGSGFMENPFRYDENGNMCLKDPEEYVNSGNNFVYSTLNNTTARYRQFSSYTSSTNPITNSNGTTMGNVSCYDNIYQKNVYASGTNIQSSIYSDDLFTKKNSYLYKSATSVSSGSGPSFLSLVDENINLCVIDVYPDMFPVMKAPETITLDADTSYYERYVSGTYGQVAAGYSKLKNKTESRFLDFLHVQVLQTVYAKTQYAQDTTKTYYYYYRNSYYDPDGGTCTITDEVLPDWDKLYAALNGENNFSFDYTVEVTDDEGNRCRTTYPFRVTCSKTTTSPTTSTTETSDGTPQYPDLVEKEYEICYHGNGAVTKYSEDSYVQGGYLLGDTDIVLAENRFVNEKINGTKTTFLGWSVSETATAAANADKIWKAGTVFSAADLFSESYTLTDGVRLDLYAVWDEYPNLSAEDIFLTTQQAKSSLTAQRLLSLCSAAATDKEDDNKTLTGQITICEEDIQASLWNADAGSVIPMTLHVTDSAGNTAEKKVKIYIYDLTLEIITRDSYVRFISPAYYKCEQEKGGLSGQSVWRQREPYASLLEETMGKVTAVINEDAQSDHSAYAAISKVFTPEDVVQMKEDLEN